MYIILLFIKSAWLQCDTAISVDDIDDTNTMRLVDLRTYFAADEESFAAVVCAEELVDVCQVTGQYVSGIIVGSFRLKIYVYTHWWSN